MQCNAMQCNAMHWFIKLGLEGGEKSLKSLEIVKKFLLLPKFFGSKLVMEEIMVVYCLSAF